jgi:hypothetical protein
MPAIHIQRQAITHPLVPDWELGLLPIKHLADGRSEQALIDVSRDEAPKLGQAVYDVIQKAPSQMLIGIDLRNISLMPSFLWRQLGPLLQTQVLLGALGSEKRILYITGGDEETLRNLQWAFRDAAMEASQLAGKLMLHDRAALVPAASKGYCGVLRSAYEEVFLLVNKHAALSNEDLVNLVAGRYSPNNANNYLTGLAELGLIYRQKSPRTTGGYASRAYGLSVSEEVMEHAPSLI